MNGFPRERNISVDTDHQGHGQRGTLPKKHDIQHTFVVQRILGHCQSESSCCMISMCSRPQLFVRERINPRAGSNPRKKWCISLAQKETKQNKILAIVKYLAALVLESGLVFPGETLRKPWPRSKPRRASPSAEPRRFDAVLEDQACWRDVARMCVMASCDANSVKCGPFPGQKCHTHVVACSSGNPLLPKTATVHADGQKNRVGGHIGRCE